MNNILFAAINFANKEILDRVFFNNTVKEYLIALGFFALSLIILKIVKEVVISRIKKLAEKTKTRLDDVLANIMGSIHWPFFIIFSLYVSSKFLDLNNLIHAVIYYALLIVITYYVVRAFQEIIEYGFSRLIEKKKAAESEDFDPTTIIILKKIAKGILWGVAVILILQNIGYDITALVAGLGIGGIAIAFALQNILSDVFSSFSIYFDKPFEMGDFIIIGDDMGTIKKIGIKSTRIQTLQGEELVVSNRELTSARIHNYKKMEKRRIVFTLGVTYDTSVEKLKRAGEIVKEVIDKVDWADLDRVHFNKFGDFALNFEIVYYLNSSDYNVYMNTQEAINMAIKENFQKEGIKFAYPTQTILVKK